MLENVFRRLGSGYILTMMVVSRVIGSIGGGLVIYYVNLTTTMSPDIKSQFDVVGSIVVSLCVIGTVVLAIWETRRLRSVVDRLLRDAPITSEDADRAGREAVLFAGRHHLHESIYVPLSTAIPLAMYIWLVARAPFEIAIQTLIGAFVGIATVLLITFFAAERWMVPVTRFLLSRGVPIDFDSLPAGSILARMMVTFGLTIAVTVLMIGGLANQRAVDIVRDRDLDVQHQAVASLREHTVYISVAAVVTGLGLSRLLANSVASRVARLVEAMKRVQAGSLSERVQPTGNDEIDQLARQFNAMVRQLQENNEVIRELNAGLEHKVRLRTRQLSKSKRSLQRSLKKLKEYDEQKTSFFSNISHELRTPLTMILSPVERILEAHKGELPPRVVTLIDVVRINGNRLLELINQLLEFSKLEAGRATLTPSPVDLNALVTDLSLAAQPLAEQRGIALRSRLDTRIPTLAADAEKVETVLRNLMANALKFTPAGGTVEIETLLQEGCVQIAVTDTGIGIPKEDYGRVFERFVQIDSSASRRYSGTGLGLSLVKEFVELHGGTVHVESEVGLGSRFWFTLPLTCPVGGASAAPAPERTAARPLRFAELTSVPETLPGPAVRPQLPPDAPRILVADDTPEMRDLIAEILSDHYHVSVAVDGEDAWDQVRASPPEVIISDVMMPRVDGYEFCRRVKDHPATASIPFVMLTAKAELTMKIEGLNRGADDYLVKPFSPEELRARVKSLMRLRKLTGELEKRNGELQATLAELRSAQAQLIQSEKMSSLGQLVAGLAHEINNAINAVYNGIQPLNVRARKLQGLVEQLMKRLPAGDEAEAQREIEQTFRKITSLAEVVENGASRTAKIVRDLKTFSHPGSEKFDAFDLNQSLEMCLNLLANQMRHRINVHTDYGEIGPVLGPSGQINQVFMNILSNAQQAIEGRGEIFVTTRREGKLVRVSIRDTGCGMTEEVRSRIFDPFFTTKPPGIGTGLGLSLSYGIMTQIGGTIDCHSQPGQGSEFIVTFPGECERGPLGVLVSTASGSKATSPP